MDRQQFYLSEYKVYRKLQKISHLTIWNGFSEISGNYCGPTFANEYLLLRSVDENTLELVKLEYFLLKILYLPINDMAETISLIS